MVPAPICARALRNRRAASQSSTIWHTFGGPARSAHQKIAACEALRGALFQRLKALMGKGHTEFQRFASLLRHGDAPRPTNNIRVTNLTRECDRSGAGTPGEHAGAFSTNLVESTRVASTIARIALRPPFMELNVEN